MKKHFFINDAYEVVDEDNSPLFQGSEKECDDFIINHFRELISDAIGCSIHDVSIDLNDKLTFKQTKK